VKFTVMDYKKVPKPGQGHHSATLARQDHYLTFTVSCPGMVMVMRPPQVHMQVEAELRAGTFPTMTVGEPGAQGTVTGMQGMGVRTPWAAAVADATWGFERVIHMPKGMMFPIGA